MADYKKIVSVIKNKDKGFSWRLGGETNCDLGSTDTKSIYGVQKNNTSYGITWDEFKNNADALGYAANCDNFINMPDSIYNVIFKKVYWDTIQGDKIINQGVANSLVQYKGMAIGVIFDRLNSLGYVRPYSNSIRKIEDINIRLTNDDIEFINKLEKEGKSNLLFDEINQDKNKDSVYLASKVSVLTTSEKIGIGVGVLFLGYLGYKLIKR